MKFQSIHAAAALLLASAAPAQIVFDFETAGQFAANSAVSGDIAFFTETTAQALTGSYSLAFNPSAKKPFQSFTYDDPTDMESGTITVWFYDTLGPAAPLYQWGMSILLENANDPSDFGAVEVVRTPGLGRYCGSEGSVDRLINPDRFDSNNFPIRTVGWQRVDFDVTPTITTVRVNGVASTEIAAPGSNAGPLRLRIMADSATAGGFSNWTAATSGYPALPGAVYIDDIRFERTAPTAAAFDFGFETSDSIDTPAVFMGPPANNNPDKRGFFHTFEVTTAQARTGTRSAAFADNVPAFLNVEIDLSSATPGTITIPFYDSFGANTAFDKIGAAIMIEHGANPANFMALEIWNAPYAGGEPTPTYYLTARPIPFGTGFYSRYFGPRSVGWQTLTIDLQPTYTRFTVNGIGANRADGNAIYDGPGLNTNPKLRIMADSPSLGGFMSWKNNTGWTDPGSPELNALYLDVATPYVFFDNISLPLPPISNVNHWEMFE
jgi:hypothetical protein